MAKAVTLTEAGIRRLKAAEKGNRNDHPDVLAPGLFLRVNDKGKKTWMVHFRLGDRQGKFTLGNWPGLSVDDVRPRAQWCRDCANAGNHPRDVLEELFAEATASGGPTFAEIAGQYVEAAMAGKLLGASKRPVTRDTAKGRSSRFKRIITPALGMYELDQISPARIAKFLDEVEGTGGPVDRCLQDIRLLYRFASARGQFQGLPPTHGLTKRQAPEKKSRELGDEELRVMWNAAVDYGYPFGHALRLLMLTGQRRNEICEAKWSDVDWKRKLLVVPQARSKNRKGNHEVSLSELAFDILLDAKKWCAALFPHSDYIFSTNGLSSISGWSKVKPKIERIMKAELVGMPKVKLKTLAEMGSAAPSIVSAKQEILEELNRADLKPWRIHDLRHTVITRLRSGEENEEGETTFAIPIDVVQQVVNHQLTAGVTGLYDHGDTERRYRIRKREALEWWGVCLGRIVRPPTRSVSVVKFSDYEKQYGTRVYGW